MLGRQSHEGYRRECAALTYWTLRIGWQDHGRTPWHPTERTGPFAVLTSGVFPTRALACEWAAQKLGPGNWEAVHIVCSPVLDERNPPQ